jgi:hypothetical protein
VKILLINLEFDCAGVAWNLAEAIRKYHPEHDVKHLVFRKTYAAQQTDIMAKSIDEAVALAEWADVLHFNQWIWTHIPGHWPMKFVAGNDYGEGCPFEHLFKDRRVVYHFHGGRHQLCPDYWLAECERVGAKTLKCDPIAPLDATWLPNVLDVEPKRVCIESPFRVAVMGAQSDIRRNNRQIGEMLETLQIPHEFFGEIPRAEALTKRRAFPVCVDNLTQGFVGMWTWEALAMGQVPLARLDPAAAMAYEKAPIVHCPNVDWLAYRLQQLRDDPRMWEQCSNDGVTWTQEHNSPADVSRRYLEFYLS